MIAVCSESPRTLHAGRFRADGAGLADGKGLGLTLRGWLFSFEPVVCGPREQFSAIQQALQKICRKFVHFTYCNFIPNLVYLVHQMKELIRIVYLSCPLYPWYRSHYVGIPVGYLFPRVSVAVRYRLYSWLAVF